MSKIYIIGPVGSGKTTLAKKLSNELKIKYYELDNVVWQYNESGDIKRDKTEIDSLFKGIIQQDNWIIEDVGRGRFKDAVCIADAVIYIKLPRILLYNRIAFRCIKQRLKIEQTRYIPDFKMLKQMFVWVNNDLKEDKIDSLERLSKKLIILTPNTLKHVDINDIISQ